MTLLPHPPSNSLQLVSRRRFGAYVAAGNLNKAMMVWGDGLTCWTKDNTALAAKVSTILGTAHYIHKEA
jgi:hypothetical protein